VESAGSEYRPVGGEWDYSNEHFSSHFIH
jgi:hypothetical protein